MYGKGYVADPCVACVEKAVSRLEKREVEKGARRIARLASKLKASCKTAACRKEAQEITDAMVRAWKHNHGKGNNTSKDTVGGYLCWDWSMAFAEAARSVNPRHFVVQEKMVHYRGSRAVHFFVELKPVGAKGKKGTVYADDGWETGGKYVHSPPWPPPAQTTPGTWRPSPSRMGHPPIEGNP